MKLLKSLKSMRTRTTVSASNKMKVIEFGTVLECVGATYRRIGHIAELTGKALQTPESAEEIFNCIEDCKNKIIDCAIHIVSDNRNEFKEVEKQAKALDKVNQTFIDKTEAMYEEARNLRAQAFEDSKAEAFGDEQAQEDFDSEYEEERMEESA